VRYLAPARLDDPIEVTVHLRTGGKASMTLVQQAWRGNTLLAEGEVRIGCVDADTFRPRRIPTELMNATA
jgi:acyl-CoA thioester hydrolase